MRKIERNAIFKAVVTAVAVWCSQSSAFAQQAVPGPLRALTGEIELRLRPEFEAICEVTKETKGESDWFAKRSKTNFSMKIFTELATTKYSLSMAEGALYLRFTGDVDSSGNLAAKPAKFETNGTLDQKSSQQIEFVMSILQRGGRWAHGQKLRQNTAIGRSVCDLFGASSKDGLKGQWSVAGLAQISGRQGVVFSGTLLEKCVLGDISFDMAYTGWEAIDLESGLKLRSSGKGEFLLGDGKKTIEIENAECRLSGGMANNSSISSAGTKREQRLAELKMLFDKDLLNKEQYEEKMREILKEL